MVDEVATTGQLVMRFAKIVKIDDISMQSAVHHGAGCGGILPYLLRDGVLDSVWKQYLDQKYRPHKADNSDPV